MINHIELKRMSIQNVNSTYSIKSILAGHKFIQNITHRYETKARMAKYKGDNAYSYQVMQLNRE